MKPATRLCRADLYGNTSITVKNATEKQHPIINCNSKCGMKETPLKNKWLVSIKVSCSSQKFDLKEVNIQGVLQMDLASSSI